MGKIGFVSNLRRNRVDKLRACIESEYGGNRSALARILDVQPSFISDLLREKKSFGEKLAHQIEDALGKPRYWLDSPAAAAETADDTVLVAAREEPPRYHRRHDDELDPLPVILTRISGWDRTVQLALANFVETINAAVREGAIKPNGGSRPPGPPLRRKKPKRKKP